MIVKLSRNKPKYPKNWCFIIICRPLGPSKILQKKYQLKLCRKWFCLLDQFKRLFEHNDGGHIKFYVRDLSSKLAHQIHYIFMEISTSERALYLEQLTIYIKKKRYACERHTSFTIYFTKNEDDDLVKMHFIL